MAIRKAVIPEVGTVTIYKRRHTKSIRLSITHDGNIRVTIPNWAPYKAGIDFVQRKSDWIRSKTTGTVTYLKHGDRIGKAHRIDLQLQGDVDKVRTRVSGTVISVTSPNKFKYTDEPVQIAMRAACVRALKNQAEQLLPNRVAALAQQHGFTYSSVKIKQLRSRWGSCNQQGQIVLNCYLMQLPWHLIDYVILHELLHTEIMAHGPVFWQRLTEYVPDVKSYRKDIKSYQPTLVAQTPLTPSGKDPQPIPVSS